MPEYIISITGCTAVVVGQKERFDAMTTSTTTTTATTVTPPVSSIYILDEVIHHSPRVTRYRSTGIACSLQIWVSTKFPISQLHTAVPVYFSAYHSIPNY